MTSDRFFEYYAKESVKESTVRRFASIKAATERVAHHFGLTGKPWQVADIGCGAGTQSALWAQDGHHVYALDINEELVQLGRERTKQSGLPIDFYIGSAAKLPWPDASVDICLSPELLEHVKDWEMCIAESSRVLRPGGILYLSTTNKLCPVQHEFGLPGYSWYPSSLKHRYERLAVTTRPELVNHAKYPAVNWFSYYGLRRYLGERGFQCLDRFDVAALGPDGSAGKLALALIRATPATRWLAHACTPYTAVFAQKN